MQSLGTMSGVVLVALISLAQVHLSYQCNGLGEQGTGEFISGLLGGTTSTESLAGFGDGRQGVPIDDDYDLDCSFDELCRWGSDGPHENVWYKVTGTPDERIWNRLTKSPIMPDGEFAVHARKNGAESDYFMSDPITCSKNGVFTFKYWLIYNTQFKVCAIANDGSREELWCTDKVTRAKPLGSGPGLDVVLEVPDQDQEFVLAFVPLGPKGMVVVDDLYFEADDVLCHRRTTPTTTTTTTTSATTQAAATTTTEAPDVITCERLECNFNDDTICNLEKGTASSTGVSSVSKFWEVHDQSIGNFDTGVDFQSTSENPSYAGVYLGPKGTNGAEGDHAILEINGLNIQQPRQMEMQVWEATYGGQCTVALDDPSNVVWSTNEGVTLSDRNWNTAVIPIPVGTEKIFIEAANHGNNYGAVGIDEIKLLEPTGGGAGSGNEVCVP